jgi:formate dehydrogenase subunit gamma
MTQPGEAVQQDRVLRYNFKERVLHWVTASAYLYLLLTGLAFWSPWLFWLAIALGGGQISRTLHPWAGLLFALGVLYMFVLWASEMRVDDNDRAWFASVNHYIQNQDEQMPPAGKYNAGQKSLFWGFVACMVLLLLSGLVLWFPEYIPWSFRWLRYTAVLVHASSALLTIGLFLIHVYMGVFAERGALDSMVHGDVSLHFIRRYHPGWYKQITGQPANPGTQK